MQSWLIILTLMHSLSIFCWQTMAFSLSSLNPALVDQDNSLATDQGKSYSPDSWDQFDVRFPDGSYEYRYELRDGTTRYERGYFTDYEDQDHQTKKSLAVVGYYAYRMTDGRYVTVFYNADRFGYRQNHGNLFF